VLRQQRRPQLRQLLGAVLEHAEDRLAVGNVERDDPGFAIVGAFEPFGGVDELGFAEAGGELEDGFVGDRDSCEPHITDDRTHVRALAKGVGVTPEPPTGRPRGPELLEQGWRVGRPSALGRGRSPRCGRR
jgi:hypothetical protein